MSILDQYKREASQIEMFLGEIGELIGHQSGFVQRRSKLGGSDLIQILTLGVLEDGKASLERFCEVAEDLGISISGSGLHQRLSMEAVELLRQVCHLWMQQGHEQESEVLCRFPAVHIFDSSRIVLAPCLADDFAGSRQTAAMKVQLAYEYRSGRIEAIEVESDRCPDQNCPLPQLLSEAGDLAIFDLGYFDQARFARLDEAGVYFLSRLQSQVGLYHPQKPRTNIQILDCLNRLPGQITYGEMNLLLGYSQKLPVRVVYYRLPSHVAQERRRKAKQNARESGKTCTQRALDWLDWLIFITNTPPTLLSLEQVTVVYRVRWQIEILFKVWKQEMDWDVMGHWRVARVLCQFYARCLALLLFHHLLEKYQSEIQWEISWQKAYPVLKRKVQTLIRIVRQQFRGLLTFLKSLDQRFRRFATKSKRRKLLSTYELLKLVHA